MDAKEFIALKELVEKKLRDAERAGGQYEALMNQLGEEFNCDTLEQAKKELEKLEHEYEIKGEEIDAALKSYEAKFGPLMGK